MRRLRMSDSQSAPYGRRLLRACLLPLIFSGIGAEALADNFTVDSNESTFDCAVNGVSPGDTITLTGGNRGNISIRNCRGTNAQRITIRNDKQASNPTIIRGTGSNWSFECRNCEHVTIDGTGKWAGAGPGSCGVRSSWPDVPSAPQCGIRIMCASGSPNALLKMKGSSSNYTIKGVEIDGRYPDNCGSGIQSLNINDHEYSAPGEWRQGILITDNYVHNTSGTAMYLGPNWPEVRDDGDLPLRNVEVSYNYVTDTGCDAIKLKSVIEGQSKVHHNHIDTTGLSPRDTSTGCTDIGIYLFESGFTDVYNNTVINTSRNGIAQFTQHLAPSDVQSVPSRIFNNVVWYSRLNGISVSRRNTNNSAPTTEIYHNTIVNPSEDGVSIGSDVQSGCDIHDNIVAGAGISAYSASQCVLTNNRSGNVSSQRFAAASLGKFNLTATSPARNSGTSRTPSVDHNDVSRPREGVGDQGAFEFLNGEPVGLTNSVRVPKPPGTVAVN